MYSKRMPVLGAATSSTISAAPSAAGNAIERRGEVSELLAE
jgi:hypothetical protein